MAQEHSITRHAEREEFPEDFRLEVGGQVVALALKLKRDIDTKYGPRDVLEVIIRGDETRSRSLWWPRKLDFPPMQTPFLLGNPTKGEYRLLVPETSEEMTALWEKGELDGQGAPAAGLGSDAAKILAKFKTK